MPKTNKRVAIWGYVEDMRPAKLESLINDWLLFINEPIDESLLTEPVERLHLGTVTINSETGEIVENDGPDGNSGD